MWFNLLRELITKLRKLEKDDLDGNLGPRAGDTVGRISGATLKYFLHDIPGSEAWKKMRNEDGLVSFDTCDPTAGKKAVQVFSFSSFSSVPTGLLLVTMFSLKTKFVKLADATISSSCIRITGKKNSSGGAAWYPLPTSLLRSSKVSFA